MKQIFVETFVCRQLVGAGLVRAEAEFEKPTVISCQLNLDVNELRLGVVCSYDARAVFATFVVGSWTCGGPVVSTLTTPALVLPILRLIEYQEQSKLNVLN